MPLHRVQVVALLFAASIDPYYVPWLYRALYDNTIYLNHATASLVFGKKMQPQGAANVKKRLCVIVYLANNQ